MNNRGFVFVFTLIVTTIISLLVLTVMQHILLYYKALNQYEQMHQNFYQLEDLALRLLQQHSGRDCIVNQDNANQVIEQLKQRQGCLLQTKSFCYYYLIESLGDISCLIIKQKGRLHRSTHRRISVLQMNEDNPLAVLQLRYLSVGAITDCETERRFTHGGVSSWRYLILS